MLIDNIPSSTNPHVAIQGFFMELLSWNISEDVININRLDETFTQLFRLLGSWPYAIATSYSYPFYGVSALWSPDFLENEIDCQKGVLQFEKGEKYLAYMRGNELVDWNLWDDDCPYDFPAVFYSIAEIQAWFVWGIKTCIKSYPEFESILSELMECHADVDNSLNLMHRRLDGKEPWEFGPARIREPKIVLWHELVKNVELNESIRKCIV